MQQKVTRKDGILNWSKQSGKLCCTC